MAIVQFTRFKSDKPEEMIKTAKQAKAIFEKHGAEFLRLSRFHTGMWAGEFLCLYALFQLGSVRKGTGGSGKGRSICEAVRAHSYPCRVEGPQHRGWHRSLRLC